jgi:hypothetical protein
MELDINSELVMICEPACYLFYNLYKGSHNMREVVPKQYFLVLKT